MSVYCVYFSICLSQWERFELVLVVVAVEYILYQPEEMGVQTPGYVFY